MGKYSFRQVIIGIIVVAACLAVLYVVMGVMGVAIPAWVTTIFWIVVAAFVAIFVINLLMSMWNG